MRKKNTGLQANSKFALHFLFIHTPGKKKKKDFSAFSTQNDFSIQNNMYPEEKNGFSPSVGSITRKSQIAISALLMFLDTEVDF